MARPAVGRWGVEPRAPGWRPAASAPPAELGDHRPCAARWGPLRLRAPAPPPPRLAQVRRFLHLKGARLQRDGVFSGGGLPAVTPGAQGAAPLASSELLGRRQRPRGGPAPLPARCVAHGAATRQCNFPVSPAPRDAARRRDPWPRRARPPQASPRWRAAIQLEPGRPAGRRAACFVTCPRRPRDSSGSEESLPNIRGIKKSLPQLSSSSNRLSKNISSTTEKTVHQVLGDDHPCGFFKKGNRVNESHQKNSNMNAGPSRNKVQRFKTSSGKRQNKSQVPHVTPQLTSDLISQPTEDKCKESIYPEGKPEGSSFGFKCQGASGNKLFLNFQSMKIIKEDADEDSASDLSDSERILILPSPLTPPDLNLRAEEIDPVCFDLHPDQSPVLPEYNYPDFLPPPFNSWDLQEMALLLNSECRSEAMPRTGGLLGKYLDRLVRLEWLQAQTVQSEKGKGAKAKPPTTPATLWALKSPGKSKLIATALSKPPPHQEGASKSALSRKKDFHHEEAHPSYYTFQTSPKPVDVLGSSRFCSQKQTLEIKTDEKKTKSNKSTKLQYVDFACSDNNSKIQTNGNLRLPKQSATILDTTHSCKASRTQIHANHKKKGNVNNCGHSSISGEKKIKTNGVKQNTYKFK